jgi:ribulose-phosphate 3-epimerase
MKKSDVLIAPSILSADLGRLQDEIKSIEASADWVQVDVMDGHFVPNLSFGAPVLRSIKTKLPLDIHLMVSNPADRLQEFLDLRVSNITFHAEAVKNSNSRLALIKAIKEGGATAGIALKPGTPIADINDCIDEVDLVLVMSVEPGFGGQQFLPVALDKIQELRAAHPDLMIQVDGGINDETARLCLQAGANNLVAGKFVFSSKERAKTISSLRAL